MYMKILVTGSEGTIGKVVVSELKNKGHEVVTIDSNASQAVDILHDPIENLFVNIETIIHLAANPSQFINKETASKNIQIAEKVLEASRYSSTIKRVINASSINVYPYFKMYRNKETITIDTPLSPNLFWSPSEYAKAKIKTEHIVENYCKENNLSCINLRLGHVSCDDVMTKFETEWENDLEYKTFLNHKDLRKIINTSITLNGLHSYLCISNPSWLDDESILFPL
jgi:nucleoside-diphosphate-sugar epimerase